ncbi:MAG: hypothetical protein AB1779_01730 [Candidatus Thermoplasmatota archaeon]
MTSEQQQLQPEWQRPISPSKRTIIISVIVVLALIFTSVPIYWFILRIPNIEEFMLRSYSDGERAKFEAKVTDSEVIDTSYGIATLVTFEGLKWMKFCFMGNHSRKYQKGASCTVEVKFHEYTICGIKKILINELILGFYFEFDERFQRPSCVGGICLQGDIPDSDPDSFNINVSSLKSNRTFSWRYYENVLHKVSLKYRKAHEPPAPKGSLSYNILIIEGMIIFDLPSYGYGGINVSLVKKSKYLDSCLPNSTTVIDSDSDGNLSIGDTFHINLTPTADEFTFDYFVFSVAGITIDETVILNWYNGPFYSIGRRSYCLPGLVKEEYSEGKYIHKFPIDEVFGNPAEISQLNARVWSPNGRVSKSVSLESIYNGANISFTTGNNQATLSFYDTNQNGLLDSGDYFLITNLERNIEYALIIIWKNGTIIEWVFVVSIGTETGWYPLVAMQEPDRSGGNISINVTCIDGTFVEFDDVFFNLKVPSMDIDIWAISSTYGYDNKVKLKGSLENVELAVIDSDNNEYFTKGDTISITGLKPGDAFRLTISHTSVDEIYVLNTTA